MLNRIPHTFLGYPEYTNILTLLSHFDEEGANFQEADGLQICPGPANLSQLLLFLLLVQFQSNTFKNLIGLRNSCKCLFFSAHAYSATALHFQTKMGLMIRHYLSPTENCNWREFSSECRLQLACFWFLIY